VSEISDLISTVTSRDTTKCSGFLSFLRECGDHLTTQLVKPCIPNSLEHWPPEGLTPEPLLFSVGSMVVKDFVGRENCSQCDPHVLFDPGAAIGGIYGIAHLKDGAHLCTELNPSTVGILKYSSSKSAQLDTATEDGKVHQVILINYISRLMLIYLQDRITGILLPQMTNSNSDHDMLESNRIVLGVYALHPPPGCRLGHVLRHAQPFGQGWVSGSMPEPGFVVTPCGHYTKTHIDLGSGMLVHFVASGTKVWILFPPTAENFEVFRSKEWGHGSDISLEHMCLKAEKIYFVVTRPGSVFIQPANWFHAVITVHADPVAIHTSLEVVHLQSVKPTIEHIVPLIIRSLTDHTNSPDEDWVEDIDKVLRQEIVCTSMRKESLEDLEDLVQTVRTEPSK
jgi:hypothetical protein